MNPIRRVTQGVDVRLRFFWAAFLMLYWPNVVHISGRTMLTIQMLYRTITKSPAIKQPENQPKITLCINKMQATIEESNISRIPVGNSLLC